MPFSFVAKYCAIFCRHSLLTVSTKNCTDAEEDSLSADNTGELKQGS